MKKTIAAVALFASANAQAMPYYNPNNPPKVTKVCLSTHQVQDGSLYGGCNEAYNNENLKRPLLENGCAANQVAVTIVGENPIQSCLPPGVVQL